MSVESVDAPEVGDNGPIWTIGIVGTYHIKSLVKVPKRQSDMLTNH